MYNYIIIYILQFWQNREHPICKNLTTLMLWFTRCIIWVNLYTWEICTALPAFFPWSALSSWSHALVCKPDKIFTQTSYNICVPYGLSLLCLTWYTKLIAYFVLHDWILTCTISMQLKDGTRFNPKVHSSLNN